VLFFKDGSADGSYLSHTQELVDDWRKYFGMEFSRGHHCGSKDYVRREYLSVVRAEHLAEMAHLDRVLIFFCMKDHFLKVAASSKMKCIGISRYEKLQGIPVVTRTSKKQLPKPNQKHLSEEIEIAIKNGDVPRWGV